MTSIRIASLALAAAFASTLAVAQTTQPQTPTAPRVAPPPAATAPATTAPRPAPAPAATAPAPAPRPATAAPAAAPAGAVNINTATAEQLDGLPQIGPARAKAIVEARGKGGPFRDFNDLVARNVIPANAENAIKDKIRFR